MHGCGLMIVEQRALSSIACDRLLPFFDAVKIA